MKKEFLAWLMLGGFFGNTAAQSCKDAEILAMKSKWQFEKNAYYEDQLGMTATLASHIFKNTDVYKTLFVTAYPEPFGGQMEGYAKIPDPSVFDIKGHQAYAYNTSYFGFHCNADKTDIVTDRDFLSGNDADLQANDLRGVLEDVAGEFELNGKPIQVFRLAHALKSPNGLMSFEAFGHDSSVAVLITHDNKLPYRFLTRKEYLTMIRTYWQKQYQKGLSASDESEKQILDMIESAKKDYTGDMRDRMLKELNSQLEQYRKRKGADQKNLNTGNQLELDSIEYAFAHLSEEELKKPAIPKASDVYRGFITEKEGGNYFVVLDDAYFKKNLPSWAAQTFVLKSYYEKADPGSLPWVTAIRNKFPFEKLKTLIDK